MPTPLPPPPTLFLLLLLLSLSRLLLCHAQDDSTPDKSPPVPYSTSFNPSIAIIIVILISAFFFLGFFSIYLRQCGNSEDATAQGRTFPLARSRRGARGLDPSVIESFPTLVYSDVKEHKIGKGALECSVCLSEFDDEETLRLLPRCDHVFHPECIDMWLSSHTTCPVCRANLAAVDDPQSASPTPPPVADPVSPSPAPTTPPAADVIVDVDNEHDHVTIPVAEQDATTATTETTTEGERKPEVAPDLGRIESKKAGSLLLPWRSRSARPTMTQNWTEEDRERFTLRLPEYMRREVLAGKLNRSLTVTAFRGGEGSSRRRYRGEGSSRGGRSFKLGGRSDRMAKSDRWAFFSRPLSFKLTRSGGDGESSSIKRGEGSTRKVRDGDGEGSSKGKVFARGPLDCLGGGGGGSVKDGDGNGEEGSTVVLPKV